MPKFRKKPIVVDAVRWFPGSNAPGVAEAVGGHPEHNDLGEITKESDYHVVGVIQTLEGPMMVSPGDWIITGAKGERYPCKPDIFAATYEPVESE